MKANVSLKNSKELFKYQKSVKLSYIVFINFIITNEKKKKIKNTNMSLEFKIFEFYLI